MHNEDTTTESAAGCRRARPEGGKRSASDDQQVTKRSAESVPPEPRGLRGRGGERPLSDFQSARSAANSRERGSEINPESFRSSKSAAAKTKKQTKKGEEYAI
jgi:hypothetical protein